MTDTDDRSSSTFRLRTPVAFLIYNRPEYTTRVFAEIARARPPKLLIVADGPRPNKQGDREKCTAARAVIKQVDWHCEVVTNFAETNLGCRRRVSSGLDWVFATVDQAIILEDDCLPNQSFFRFCEDLLVRYEDDERVMHVSGDNFLLGHRPCETSYYFSRYPHTWGWACWRRAWRHYDVDMKVWSTTKNKERYLEPCATKSEKEFWKSMWNMVCAYKIDTWDYQWAFACLARKGISIMPAVNLVSNIGFSSGATHTVSESPVANLPVSNIEFPLKHPKNFAWFDEADDLTRRQFFGYPWSLRVISKLSRFLNPRTLRVINKLSRFLNPIGNRRRKEISVRRLDRRRISA